MGKVKRFAALAGVMAAAGYVAGVLTAPKSGREMRKELKRDAFTTAAKADKQFKDLQKDFDKLADDLKVKGKGMNAKAETEVKKLLEAAKDNKEKVRELVTAIREGGADDKDLQNALTDAKRSLKHLKEYLKK